jgi:hypothetical protein
MATIIGEMMFNAPEYRVYFLSGSVVLSRDVKCADDKAAMEQAERLYPVGIIEVWQGHRLVARIENLPASVHSPTDENVTAA